jgi:hypothetical protein
MCNKRIKGTAPILLFLKITQIKCCKFTQELSNSSSVRLAWISWFHLGLSVREKANQELWKLNFAHWSIGLVAVRSKIDFSAKVEPWTINAVHFSLCTGHGALSKAVVQSCLLFFGFGSRNRMQHRSMQTLCNCVRTVSVRFDRHGVGTPKMIMLATHHYYT